MIDILGITCEQARQIRKICAVVDDPDDLSELIEAEHGETERYVRSLHSSPYDSYLWRRTVALHAIDRVLETGGVEALYGPGQRPFGREAPDYEYCNTGDTYAATLIYSRSNGADNLFIGSWGDIAESL